MAGGEIERPTYTTAYIEALHGDPVWEAIWSVVRQWDISSDAGSTGDDATIIYEAVKSALDRPSETSTSIDWKPIATAPYDKFILAYVPEHRPFFDFPYVVVERQSFRDKGESEFWAKDYPVHPTHWTELKPPHR